MQFARHPESRPDRSRLASLDNPLPPIGEPILVKRIEGRIDLLIALAEIREAMEEALRQGKFPTLEVWKLLRR